MRAGDPHEQVGLTVAVDILEAQRDRGELLPLPKQDRAAIDPGFGRVARRQLDDQDVSVQVKSEEVAGMSGRVVVVSDHGVGLEGAWPAVVPIVLGRLPPDPQRGQGDPAQDHD
ncbi:MAG TPA: hypothetical protein VF844_14710 [Ktedonobacteraceae bacterium]